MLETSRALRARFVSPGIWGRWLYLPLSSVCITCHSVMLCCFVHSVMLYCSALLDVHFRFLPMLLFIIILCTIAVKSCSGGLAKGWGSMGGFAAGVGGREVQPPPTQTGKTEESNKSLC